MVSGLLFFYCLWYLNELHRYVEQQRLHITTKDRHSDLSSSWVIRPWLIWKMFLTCSSFTIWNIWMKLHRYVDHQRLHIVTKDVISLSISVLLLFRHYISHKITFGALGSGGVLCSACGDFMHSWKTHNFPIFLWKGFSDETPCVHFSFCFFLRLQFYFVNYVIYHVNCLIITALVNGCCLRIKK